MTTRINLTTLISLALFLLLGLILAGCGSTELSQASPSPTQTTAPADTPTATLTPEPPTPTLTPVPPTATDTPTPVPPTATPSPLPPTATPTPTETPVPTETPAPTDTPTPADTPTPSPPTFTPTPAVSPAEAHFQQGSTYFDQEQWDLAIAEFRQVITLEPEFGLAYLALGYSYIYGDKDLEGAVKALEKYLELVPDATDRAEVEADIQKLREFMASQPFPTPPPGKALFYFRNYTGEHWIVDVGPYSLEVPPNPPGQEYYLATMVIDPGTYTWQAHSVDGNYYISDETGSNRAFEFTIAAGEAYGTGCCK